MPLTVFTQRNFVADFVQSKCNFRGKTALGTLYDVHLGLTGKRAVDLLSVLIELFSLDVTAEALPPLQRGQFDPKFHVEGDVSYQ